MWDIIWQFIAEKYPLLIVVALTAVATWWIKGFYDSSKEVKKKVNELPCDSHKIAIETIQNNTRSISDISASIRKIEEWLIKKDVNAMGDLVRKCSPYQLTEIGLLMLEKSEAKYYVDNNLQNLLAELKATKPLTAYDVETNSLKVLSDMVDTPSFNGIKDFIYTSPSQIEFTTKEGVKSTSIDMRRVLMIMSIYLRDKYFEAHPEINTEGFPPKVDK